MTDPTQPEGGQEQVNQGLPTPTFTDASAGSATSSVDTKAIAKEVADILRPDFERVAQSTKDKRIAEIQKRLGMSDLAELEGLGVQIPENVKLEYRLRQIEEGRQNPEGSRQAPTSQGSGASLTSTDVSEVVKNLKLDANDPDVLEKLRGTYRNRDHFEATMASLALARANTPQPSPTEAAALQAAPPSGSGSDTATLVEELAKLQKEPSKNKARIGQLAAELDKRGWK